MATRHWLTVTADYVPAWGFREGCREIIANALDAGDAQVSLSVPYEYRPGKHRQDLRVTSNGGAIGTRALLLGATSKRGRDDQIGQHGEGLKLGMLALLREGYGVRVVTRRETWTAAIRKAAQYQGERLLCVDVAEGGYETLTDEQTRVEIEGITSEQYDEVVLGFMDLGSTQEAADAASIYNGWAGRILTGPAWAGRIYVKGVYIQTVEGMSYGYDLKRSVTLNRDRTIVEDWSRDSAIVGLWDVAAQDNAKCADTLYALFNRSDAREASAFVSRSLSTVASKALDERFAKEHGRLAICVAHHHDYHDVERLGRKPVILPAALASALEAAQGDLPSVLKRLEEAAQRTYAGPQWRGISAPARKALKRALATLALVEGVEALECRLDPTKVVVVDFPATACVRGQYQRISDTVRLSHSMLTEAGNTGDEGTPLQVLVHEVAHRAGSDESQGAHQQRVEAIWAALWRARSQARTRRAAEPRQEAEEAPLAAEARPSPVDDDCDPSDALVGPVSDASEPAEYAVLAKVPGWDYKVMYRGNRIGAREDVEDRLQDLYPVVRIHGVPAGYDFAEDLYVPRPLFVVSTGGITPQAYFDQDKALAQAIFFEESLGWKMVVEEVQGFSGAMAVGERVEAERLARVA